MITALISSHNFVIHMKYMMRIQWIEVIIHLNKITHNFKYWINAHSDLQK
jgi:hypothetical protein